MPIDLEAFLNKTFYQIDVQAMLLSVVDFLEFSEQNIPWQRRRDLERARHEADNTKFSPEDRHYEGQYRAQLLEGVEYRYDVSLTQRLRYAGLVSFVTVIDWAAFGLQRRLNFALPARPKATSESIHTLAILNARSGCGLDAQIDDLLRVIHARNCVVHAAGLIEHYEYRAEMEQTLAALRGFSLTDANWLGRSVMIERGAVEVYARAMHDWLPVLDERCTEQGLLKS